MKMNSNIGHVMRKFAQCDSGVSAIEYALIASTTSLALVASLPSVEANLIAVYTKIMNFF